MNRSLMRTLVLAFLAAVLAAPAAHASSCAVSTFDFDGNGVPDLKVTALSNKQNVVLDIGDAISTLSVDCNGDGDFLDAALGDVNAQAFVGPLDTYILQLGGADNITVNIPADMTGVAKTLQITMGPGNNTVTINGGGATLHQSRLLVDVAGYTLIDKLTVTLPGADASAITFRTDLSLGNDEARFTLGGDITNGSVVDLDAVLNLGANIFTFTQPATQTISNSTLNVNVEGSTGIDTVTTAFNGQVSGASRILMSTDLGPGNDKYTNTFDLTTFDIGSGSEVRFDVSGGAGDDVMTFTRNATAGGATTVDAGLLDIHADGGIGNDTITVDLGGGGFQMNGGTLGLRAIGGQGNDTINATLEADTTSTNPIFDVFLFGAGQIDTLTLKLDNKSGSDTAANYGPAGMVLLDGGGGTDTCTVTGISSAHVHKRNCP